MNLISKTVITAALLVLANAATAGGYSIEIGGDYTSQVDVGAVTSVAIGKDARADTNIGGIQVEDTNVKVGGDYNVSVDAGAVTAVAIGENVSARINLGGIQSLQ